MLDKRQTAQGPTEGNEGTINDHGIRDPLGYLVKFYGKDPGSWFGRRFTLSTVDGRATWQRRHNGITVDIVQCQDPARFDLIVWARGHNEDHIIAGHEGTINGLINVMIDHGSTWQLYGHNGRINPARLAKRDQQFAGHVKQQRARITGTDPGLVALVDVVHDDDGHKGQ